LIFLKYLLFNYFYQQCGVARSKIYIINSLLDLREIGWDGMDWIDLLEDRDQRRAAVNTVINNTSGSIKCWEVLEWLHNWQLLKKGSAP
jgi:hypothetical protein